MEKNLTTGSVLQTIVFFAVPYLLSYFLQTLYGMADLFIIGQYNGVASTTGVAIGSQVMHMLTVMLVGLAMGTTILTARAVGGGQKEQIAKTIGNTTTLFGGLSVILTILLVMMVGGIVSIMSTPVEAVQETTRYLTICFIGIPFITAYNILSSILRGLGDSKSPMYFIAVACVINIFLDYVFIGIVGMGAAGAALGTTLAQTISVLIALWFVTRQATGITISWRDFHPDTATMKELLKIGVPISLQDGFIQIAFITITIIVNMRGLSSAAAVGIVEKIIGILFMIPSSMLSTVSALAAQNAGAGKHDRARTVLRYACMIVCGWGSFVVVWMHFGADPLVALFTSDAEVVRLGGEYMRGYAWDCILAGIHFCFSGFFCAYSYASISFIHNVLAIVLMRIPGAYFTSIWWPDTLYPMGLATAAGSMISVIICIGAYIWLRKRGKLA